MSWTPICPFVFAGLLMVSAVKSPAQSASKLDKLLDVLHHPFDNDSLHAIAYEDLIWYYIEQADEPQVLSYLDSLKLFGMEQHYGYAELLYEFNVSYFYFRKSLYDSASWHMERVVLLSDSLSYPKQKFNALSRLATMTKVTGDLDASMIYLKEATQIAEELQIPKLMARALLQKASVSYDIGDYMTALEGYIRVD